MSVDYSMADLESLSGIPARTIRSFIQRGLLPRARYASNATRYDRRTLGLLSVIATERSKHGSVWNVVSAKLKALTDEQIEDWADALDPLGPIESENAPAIAEASAPVTPAAPEESPAAAPVAATSDGERWLRIELVPGLELARKEGAGELVERLAREIRAKYGVTR